MKGYSGSTGKAQPTSIPRAVNHEALRYTVAPPQPITSYPQGPCIPFCALFSNTLNFGTFLTVTHQVSHPYTTN